MEEATERAVRPSHRGRRFEAAETEDEAELDRLAMLGSEGARTRRGSRLRGYASPDVLQLVREFIRLSSFAEMHAETVAGDAVEPRAEGAVAPAELADCLVGVAERLGREVFGGGGVDAREEESIQLRIVFIEQLSPRRLAPAASRFDCILASSTRARYGHPVQWSSTRDMGMKAPIVTSCGVRFL